MRTRDRETERQRNCRETESDTREREEKRKRDTTNSISSERFPIMKYNNNQIITKRYLIVFE